MAKLAVEFAAAIKKVRGQDVLNTATDCLRFSREMNISFRIAR